MTTPIRPAEPACAGYRLPTHPGAPEERVHCNGCAEAASLREQLDDLYRVWRRDRGAWRARLSAVEGERDEAKHEAAELRGLVKRWAAVDEETGLCLCYEPADRCDADGACPGGESRAWLAAHPLKTEGDGGTPTTETKGQP